MSVRQYFSLVSVSCSRVVRSLGNKVNDVPDFVHFSHERHLQKFLFDNPEMDIKNAPDVCAMCHGDMNQVGVAKKMKPLTMGFCIRCHENNQGPSDCTRCHK